MSYKQQGGMASSSVHSDVEHVTPVPEHPDGIVFPYRGIENHGVKPETPPPPYVDDEWPEDSEEPHYTVGPTEEDPIPVRIVKETSRELTIIRSIPFLVTDQPKPILARNERRQAVRLRNSDVVTTTTSSDSLGTSNVTTQLNLTASGQTGEFVIPADGWSRLIFGLKITSLTGTTPGVTVKIQETINGTDWVDLVTFTAATGATYELKKTTDSSSNRIRVVWTTTGTVTDLDFTVDVMRFPVARFTTSTASGGNNVYIGHESSLTPVTGYLVAPGAEVFPITTEDEMYAVCESGKTSTVYLLTELSVEL